MEFKLNRSQSIIWRRLDCLIDMLMQCVCRCFHSSSTMDWTSFFAEPFDEPVHKWTYSLSHLTTSRRALTAATFWPTIDVPAPKSTGKCLLQAMWQSVGSMNDHGVMGSLPMRWWWGNGVSYPRNVVPMLIKPPGIIYYVLLVVDVRSHLKIYISRRL